MKRGTVILILMLLLSSASAEVLRHDFSNLDLEGWVISEDHQAASIENGELIAGVPPPQPDITTLVLLPFKGMPASDYDVAVSVKLDLFVVHPIVANGTGIGLRGHSTEKFFGLVENDKLQDPRSLGDLGYYFFIGQNTEEQWGVGASIWHIEQVLVNAEGIIRGIFVENTLLRFAPFDVKLGEWYRLRVIAEGNLFRVFINEEQMLGLRDVRYSEGIIFLSSGFGNLARFDDFEVTYDAAAAVQPQKKLTTRWSEIKIESR